jgi:hypothetical protein
MHLFHQRKAVRVVGIILSDWVELWVVNVVVLVSVQILMCWWYHLVENIDVRLLFILDGDARAPLEKETVPACRSAVFIYGQLLYSCKNTVWHRELVPLLS